MAGVKTGCHVMERESFENEDIAKLLNRHFIPIKVDREERPDIDRIYMNFVSPPCARFVGSGLTETIVVSRYKQQQAPVAGHSTSSLPPTSSPYLAEPTGLAPARPAQ